MVPSQKLIAVVGGTGQLGSSVAISLHDNPEFQVRVLSRDPTSAKAQRLVKLGIQVVKADNWSDTDLQSAFRGCWGIFINLNSDLPNFKRKIGPSEFENGKIVVDAAVKAGVKHVVHASLPPASKLTNGKIPVYSFDDKRAISDYALAQDEFQTVTLVNAGWFLENAFDPAYETVFGGLATKVDEEGFYTWKCPSMGNDPELVPWLSVTDDYGDFVHGVFLDPQRWNKKVIHAVSESLSFAGMAASFQKGRFPTNFTCRSTR
ncbi:unnamed protein product [Clonostachys byssicola]|uniref:NmrA-like domain-containing protein n=1 Tax=Clonostachys byssicola TaxID=160290 RepID=A0A9N9UMQ7_9HYPO|nr:unnamed protein product [Clonostachys byssicola]